MQCLVGARKLYTPCQASQGLIPRLQFPCFLYMEPWDLDTYCCREQYLSILVISLPQLSDIFMPPTPQMNHCYQFPVQSDFQRRGQEAIYWSWEIGKPLNFSCNKFLWFPLKWALKYTRQVYTQTGVRKSALKITKKRLILPCTLCAPSPASLPGIC